LTAGTSSPALQRSVIEYCTSVKSTRTDRKRSAARSEIHGLECVANFPCIITNVICIPVAESTFGSIPPTLHGCVVKNHARVSSTSGNCERCAACSEINGGQCCDCRTNSVADVCSVIRSETAISSRTPALH